MVPAEMGIRWLIRRIASGRRRPRAGFYTPAAAWDVHEFSETIFTLDAIRPEPIATSIFMCYVTDGRMSFPNRDRHIWSNTGDHASLAWAADCRDDDLDMQFDTDSPRRTVASTLSNVNNPGG